jgi:hypothetical protein
MLSRLFSSIIAFFRKLLGLEEGKGDVMEPRKDEYRYIDPKVLFERYGIKVTIQDPERIKPVIGPELPEAPSDPEVYEPFRVLLNLLFSTPKSPTDFVEEFDPPIMLQIGFTKEDLAFVYEREKELAMAFWDGEQVVVFNEEKHKFKQVEESWGDYAGSCVMLLSHWKDPMITVGRR